MAKVLCVLYDDPVDGYPTNIRATTCRSSNAILDGQTLPTPKAIDFKPGALLGSVSGELGLRKFLEAPGHTFVVTSDKDGPNSVFERELPDADIVISQPFWPAYLTAERFAKAQEAQACDHCRHRLGPCRSAGGDRPRDHRRRGHLLQLDQRLRACGDDDPGAGAQLHPVVRLGGEGRLEHRRLRRALLRCRRHACRHRRRRPDRPRRAAPAEAVRREAALHRSPSPSGRGREGARPHLPPNAEDMVKVCDVVTINAPLHPETENLFNDRLIAKMKRGAYLVNTARGKICDRDAIVRALESGQLAGYAGDVWFPQPAPKDHPWRTMPHHGMTPHISGTLAVGAGALCGRHARDSRMLLRGAADPRRISDRRRRQARGRGRALLQRRRRDQGIGGRRQVQRGVAANSGGVTA